jgi:hypothetical protein
MLGLTKVGRGSQWAEGARNGRQAVQTGGATSMTSKRVVGIQTGLGGISKWQRETYNEWKRLITVDRSLQCAARACNAWLA